MKKRHFLQTSIAFAGLAALSRYLPTEAQERNLSTKSQARTAVQQNSTSAAEGPFEINKTAAEWREILTPEEFGVLRLERTEAPFSSPLNDIKTAGTYSCAGCDLPLFSSETKFDSGTGWPSFYAPIEGAVGTASDRSLLMVRTEVHCSRCGGHLGHVFDDGPAPTGKRYCMNGVAMRFTET